ncbi:hypothetical protein V2N23_07465 [Streptococcus pneumoniae]
MESKKIAKQILIATAVLTSFLGSNLVYADVVQSNSNNRASTETARVTGNNWLFVNCSGLKSAKLEKGQILSFLF